MASSLSASTAAAAAAVVRRLAGLRRSHRSLMIAAASPMAPSSARLRVIAPSAPRARFHASAVAAKTIPFNLPDIGEGIAEVEVVQWFVKEGDRVEQFDKLMEVQSDKATVEITSRYDGVIRKLYYTEGDVAPTGSPLVDIELDDPSEAPAEEGAAASETTESTTTTATPDAAKAAQEETTAPAQSSSTSSGKGLATPAVRRIAREHNIDIANVPATGKDGRVLKGDILAFIETGGRAQGDATGTTGAAATAASTTPTPTPAGGAVVEDDVRPIRGIQKAMVKSMNAAWQVPHFGYCDEITMDKLMELRTMLKPMAEQRDLKLSYMPLMIKATSLALTQFPELNATVNPEATELTVKGAHNIGVAIDSPRGLIVPNIKNCQSLTVFEIAAELLRVQELAKEGKLGEPDLTGGTFSLSNIGAIGGTYASPVLMMPQVAIGAIGKLQRVPRFSEGGQGDVVVPAHLMRVSWAADHRVVDGATMARFSNLWKQYLENPITMLTDMK